MKTAAYILGALSAVLTIASSPAVAGQSGTPQEQFYAAIDRQDLGGVLEVLHPSARKLVDAPVLDAWMQAIGKNLGASQQIEVLERKVERRLTGRREETHSKVVFTRGEAESEVIVVDGQIIAFHVVSPQMANWFQGPTSVQLYADMAEAFMEDFLAGRTTAAHESMHPALQKEISFERLEEMIQQVCSNGGALKQLTLKDHRFSLEGSAPALFLTYDVVCEKATGSCELEFQFEGMKGYLLGFYFR